MKAKIRELEKINSIEPNSYMLCIHPPLAIAGYILIFLFATFMFVQKKITKNT
jgi:hypothetical protein